MLVKNTFRIGQVIYIKTDPEQLPRIVIALRVTPDSIMYEVAYIGQVSLHYDLEINADKDVLLALN